jgi:glyoxylase-like metal-dependent hydrolase (beta-lactamase superfamily II)
MRIHHLNCISTCPLGGALMDGRSLGLRGRLACHVLLVETADSLVLVDTGFGLNDVLHPRPRLSRFFLALLAPELRAEMTAIRQIRRLGFDPRDVRHIVLTHLDFDHAGGLDDFPHAAVHMMGAERQVALAQRTMLDRMRYRPLQWRSTVRNWRAYRPNGGDDWFGFRAVRQLEGLPPEIALVPLVGHTRGHAGVAVRREKDWLLLAGDAYFWHGEMDLRRPRCTPGLRFYQWMMEQDRRARLWNQRRLRELKRMHGREVQVLSSHDPFEFQRAAGRPLSSLAGQPAWPQRSSPAAIRRTSSAARSPASGVPGMR